MSQPIRSAGRELYLSSGSTATGFTVTAGAKSSAQVDQASGTLPVLALGTARGWKMHFVGNGSDNDAYSARLWGVDFLVSEEGGVRTTSTDYVCTLFGTAAVVLGTSVGVGVPSGSFRYADTVVWTAATAGTNAESAYGLGTTTAYSPADNTVGCLFVPNFPFHGLIIDFDQTTGTPTMNVVVQRMA